jgi:hypothetical protein
MHRDLVNLNEMGFTVVAMTIIGLPYDTEDSIMALADWVTQVSKYQTANFLTPLPATSNWNGLQPLNEDGGFLEEGEMRPYHLYTGRQLVHHDERWSMQESREVFDRYTDRLSPVDDVYRRIFRILRTYKLRLAATSRDLSDTIAARVSDAAETLDRLSGPASIPAAEFDDNLSTKVSELVETLRSVSQPLANARKDLADGIGNRLTELTESLKTLTDSRATASREMAASISVRITEITDLIDKAVPGGRKRTGTATG